MEMLYSTPPVKLQNVEILSKDENTLLVKWEHTDFLSTFLKSHMIV